MKKSVLEIHEELVTYGEKTQSTEKLIEIIIGNEKKAKEIIENYETLEDALGKKNYETLLTAGLTKGEAQRLIAAIEIGKRIAASDTEVRNHITSPGDAAKFLMPRLRHGTHEEFLTILLNTKNRVIKTERIAEGSLTSAVVHPREVFASAIVRSPQPPIRRPLPQQRGQAPHDLTGRSRKDIRHPPDGPYRHWRRQVLLLQGTR